MVKDIATPNGLRILARRNIPLRKWQRCRKFVRRYAVQPDDSLTDSRMFIDISGDKNPGITDGMKVDTTGNVYESGPGGLWIISPEGNHLGTVPCPRMVANLEFGDGDRKTLYVAAQKSIYKIRVNTPGLP